MTESHRILQSFFRHAEIRLYISFFEDEDILTIKTIYACYQLPIFLREYVSERIHQFIVVTMCLSAFFESGIFNSCLLVIISQIGLGHESVIHDIIPITDKE